MQHQIMKKQKTIDMRVKCWRLRIMGYEQHRIATTLGCSQQYVSKLLKKSADLYHKENMKDVERWRAEQIEQNYHIYAQAMKSWRKSKKQHKKNKTEKGVARDKNGNPIVVGGSKITQETSDQYGDPRYLETALKALKALREICGINAPIKHAGPDGQPINLTVPVLEQQINELVNLLSEVPKLEGETAISDKDIPDKPSGENLETDPGATDSSVLLQS